VRSLFSGSGFVFANFVRADRPVETHKGRISSRLKRNSLKNGHYLASFRQIAGRRAFHYSAPGRCPSDIASGFVFEIFFIDAEDQVALVLRSHAKAELFIH